MTETPRSPGPDRLTALEAGLQHLREVTLLREQALHDRILELSARHRVLEMEVERRTDDMTSDIEALRTRIWSGLIWCATAMASVLSAIVLKALNLI